MLRKLFLSFAFLMLYNSSLFSTNSSPFSYRELLNRKIHYEDVKVILLQYIEDVNLHGFEGKSKNFFNRMLYLKRTGSKGHATRELRKLFQKEGYHKSDLKNFDLKELLKMYADHFSIEKEGKKDPIEIIIHADTAFEKAERLEKEWLELTARERNRTQLKYRKRIEQAVRKAKIILLDELVKLNKVEYDCSEADFNSLVRREKNKSRLRSVSSSSSEAASPR